MKRAGADDKSSRKIPEKPYGMRGGGGVVSTPILPPTVKNNFY